MSRLPSLDSLRVFVVAARHLSFTTAANELNLTQSAISHRIRTLEEDLGFPLFDRLTRRLELTSAGRTIARRVGLALGEIERSLIDIRPDAEPKQLRITLTPSVASFWLIPRLPRIRARLPELDVQVVADPRPLDLRAEGLDLAIRFCRAPSAGYAATRMMGDRVLPVCSPDLLHPRGPVDGMEPLLALPLLHDYAAENDDSDTGWRSWLDFHGRPDLACHAGQHFSDASMLINAALLGLGVALARASLVTNQLANGSLISPLEIVAPSAYSYYLLGMPETLVRPDVARFRQVLLEEAAMTETFTLSLGTPLPAGFDEMLTITS
jgi:LysR family glycine cleavage system transcriptional activator